MIADTMAHAEPTIIEVLFGEAFTLVIPPLDGLDKNLGNNEDMFGLAPSILHMKGYPAKGTPCDFKDLFPA